MKVVSSRQSSLFLRTILTCPPLCALRLKCGILTVCFAYPTTSLSSFNKSRVRLGVTNLGSPLCLMYSSCLAITLPSLQGWQGMHFNPPRPRFRPQPVRKCVGEMVASSHCRVHFGFRHFYASLSERRERCESRCCEGMAGDT